MPRRRAVARRRHAGPGLHRHAGARSRHASSRRSPGRGGRRTGCPVRRRKAFDAELPRLAAGVNGRAPAKVAGANYDLHDGDVVIAAITSCTNTSNPSVMLAAGLLAKKAVEKGLKVKPWVKTSLAPGSQVVSDYYAKAGLRSISTGSASISSAMAAPPASAIPGRSPSRSPRRLTRASSSVGAVLSGNRNFEGRIHAAGARQLSGLAAAGRRLRPGRLDPHTI